MSKQDAVFDKKIMDLQYQVNRHQTETLQRIKVMTEDYIQRSKEKGWSPNQTMLDINKMVRAELDYLDVKGSRLDCLRKRTIPPEQDRLTSFDTDDP